MHRAMVRKYNDYVDGEHLVLWLGDCFMYMQEHEARTLLSAMNGRKALVIGNHDKSKIWMARIGFTFVVDELMMEIAGRHVLACHYPYANTNRRHGDVDTRFPKLRPKRVKGRVLMHGHTHDRRRRRDNMIHVGVDAWDYAPATYGEVEKLIEEI